MFDRLGAIAAEHDVRLILAALGVCLLSGVISARLYTQGRRESRFFRNLWIGATGMLAGTGAWATHLLALMAFGPAWGGHYQAVLAASGWLVSTTGATIAVTLAIHQREAQARLAAGAIFGLALCAMAAMGFASLQPLARLQWDGEYISLWGAGAMLTAMGAVWALGRGDGLVWRGLFGIGLTLSVAMVHLAGLTAATATVGPGARVDDLSIGVPVLGAIVIFLLLATTAVSIGAVVISARSQVQALGDLREAINAMPAGLAFYDRDDRCIIWNATYAVVGGQGAPALRPGVTFRELIEAQLAAGDLPDGVGREADYLEERLRSRRESAGPVEQLFGERWLRVEDRRTSTGGTVSIIHDITDLKDIARTVEAARDQAQAANRAKSEFLANMSHELRTPLNGVIGVAQALARTRMTARQREMLQTVQSSALTLQGVLSDLLDLARIESGRLELTCERFSMGAVLKDAASLWRLEAQKKGVEFQLDLGDGAAADVHGDQVRLRQVVVNLLSNAVKFTADGVVAMRAWRDPADPDLLCLSVRDSGIGFPPEVAERLFVRFEQADGSVTRRFGGTGLGLAISRDLVERMGGRIWAEGQPGEGATFHVELPMAALEGLDPAAQGPAWVSAEAMSRPLRVMCAEDHPVNRKVVEFILEAAGVELVCAVDGREAVELFRTQRFDAILMDMQMPVMDGLSATQEIRRIEAEEGLPRTPVIMVTANAMPEHLASSQAAGADHHLTKPIAADKLMSMLERVTADALFAEAEAA